MAAMNSFILNVLKVLLDDETRRWNELADYCRDNHITVAHVAGFCGSISLTEIQLLSNKRFDIASVSDTDTPAEPGIVLECIDRDGETPLDLVAWPIADPTDVRTLLGKAPMLGLWQALNPMQYTFERPLVVQRTPLDWLQAGCDGAAIITPDLAARIFLEIADLGGLIGAQDVAHGQALRGHLRSMIDRVDIVCQHIARRAA